MRELLVIGGGFSAAALLLALRHGGTRTRIRILEPRQQLGRGLAYSAWEREGWGPLLNVPAGRMGLLRGQEDGFARWWSQRGGSAHDFAPRALYGDYVESCLRGAMPEHVRASVQALHRSTGGWTATLSDGTRLQADAVVLCTGHTSRGLPPGPWGQRGWVDDPWTQAEALDALPADRPLLLLGSGLTAVDAWQRLSLRSRAPLTLLSRHGWLPQAHRSLEQPPPAGLLADEVMGELRSSRAMLRAWRQILSSPQHGPRDWRDLLADLRRHTPRLWQQLPLVEQQRALRHLQSLWDSHRHRLAPAVAAPLQLAQEQGALRRLAGRLLDAAPHGDGWRLQLRLRGGQHQLMEVAGVVNCTGPAPRSCAASDGLWAQGLAAGWAQAHANGLGPACDAMGRVLDATGAAQASLWLLGPGLRARDWEATAVPELRAHAARLADQLLAADAG